MGPLKVLIVNKDASLTAYQIKEYSEDKLFKKCGFKSVNGFKCFTTWCVEVEGTKYGVKLYGKETGKPMTENKYEFPPPVDTTLLFGNALLVGFRQNDETFDMEPTDLTESKWKKFEEELFGGFEDLTAPSDGDESDEDELLNVSPSKKTKSGYLKDSFVVETSDEDCCEDEVVPKVEPKSKTKADTKTKKSKKDKDDTTSVKNAIKKEKEKTKLVKTTTKKESKEPKEKNDNLLMEEEYIY
jgi:hypothetical protein